VKIYKITMKQSLFALLFILVFSHCLPAKETNSSRFDSEDVNSGWKKSPWLGYFYAPLGDWIFHNKLQWLFVGQDTNDSNWFFSERIGWLWTSSGNFPYMWVNNANEWIYFDSNPKKVFSYQSNTWYDLEDYSDLKGKINSLEIQRQEDQEAARLAEIQRQEEQEAARLAEIQRQEEQEAARLAEIQRQILELYTLSTIQGQHRNIVWDIPSNRNPKYNSSINPKYNSSINPRYNSSINPKYNSSINPKYNSSINPTISPWIGSFLFSIDGEFSGVIAVVNSSYGLIYNPSGDWLGYIVFNENNGYNLFNIEGEWAGFLLSNGAEGLNLFNISGEWLGFTT
jgi:hypothetical protein